MRRIFTPLLAVAALLAGCGPAGGTEPAQPALWVFSDDDTTIYLFGTIHVLPKGIEWENGAVATALDSADRLILEVTDPAGIAGIRRAFETLASSPGLPPVADRIAPHLRPALDAMIAKSGLPRATLDRQESWAAALTLAASLYPEIGVDPEQGVETRLTARFATQGKSIAGLETAQEQLGYFDRLPEAAQRQFLESVIADAGNARAEFKAMVTAWRHGDVDGLALTAEDEARLSPALADALKRQRNLVWAERLARELDRPGTVMVAVGAAHLAGRDSVQQLLEARGVTVRRLQ